MDILFFEEDVMNHVDAVSTPLVKLHTRAAPRVPRRRLDGVLVGVAALVVAWGALAALVLAALAPLANVVH